ncbi:S41 family peptidase [Anaerotalea alkaliphila]|uniref:S41 family peptidase n=1 Tax=Anaerotalea alkaliphila TaxID=2662126 RepID=A0A7X5KM75_9FIRM|nr:S41 family peptidase [Anaerotalea alkaliphila]NDL67651.1 S41 family peptidase [Anaerotalea alkaliphila]
MRRNTGFLKGFIAGVLTLALLFSVYMGVKGLLEVAYRSGLPLTSREYRDVGDKMRELGRVLEEHYLEEVEVQAMEEEALRGFVAGLGDPYTTYFSQEEYSSFLEKMEGSYEGIGVVISYGESEEEILVVAPFPGTPGAMAGIQPGDRIMEVDKEPVSGMSLDMIVERIKGEKGTQVSLTLYRKRTEETLEVQVTRDVIDVPTIDHAMLEDQIGYIQIAGFEENTYDQFKEALEDLEGQGIKGLVVDLRNNPGGFMHIVAAIGNELVPEGMIVYTEDKNGERSELKSDNKTPFDKPLVVLVNEYSASASEILAGAVKDRGVGTVVGVQTFGKGLVQRNFELGDGSAVKVTIAKYYTPNGSYINGVGIAPDVVLPLEEAPEGAEQAEGPVMDNQLQKAVEIIRSQQ